MTEASAVSVTVEEENKDDGPESSALEMTPLVDQNEDKGEAPPAKEEYSPIFEAIRNKDEDRILKLILEDETCFTSAKDKDGDSVVVNLAWIGRREKYSASDWAIDTLRAILEVKNGKATRLDFLTHIIENELYGISWWIYKDFLEAILNWGGKEVLEKIPKHVDILFGAAVGSVRENEAVEEKACEIMELVLSLPSFPKESLNSVRVELVDEGYTCAPTVLQIAAEAGLTEIVQLLVDNESTDILIKDAEKRTAVHAAAAQANFHLFEEGKKILGILIDKLKAKEKFGNQDIWHEAFFEDKDKDDKTPFMFLCETYPEEDVHNFLTSLGNFKNWASPNVLNLIYTTYPILLTDLLNKSMRFVSEEKKGKRNGGGGGEKGKKLLEIDFGIITGYETFTEQQAAQGSKRESNKLREIIWAPAEIKSAVLLHPLVQLYIENKWSRFKTSICTRLIVQIVWVIALAFLLLHFYSPHNAEEFEWKESEDWVYPVEISAIFILYLGTIGLFAVEVAELIELRVNYWKDPRNLFQMMQVTFALSALYPVWPFPEAKEDWNKYAGTIGLFISSLLLMREIGKAFSHIGILIELLLRVLRKTAFALICCTPIWGAFVVVFHMLFSKDFMYTGGKYVSPVARVMAMMVGEFEYGELFKTEEDVSNSTGEPAVPEHGAFEPWMLEIRLLVFLVFLVVIPVGFFNLLTGFAFEQVIEMSKEKALVAQMGKKLDHIAFMESFLQPIAKFWMKAFKVEWSGWVADMNLIRHVETGNVENSKIRFDLRKSTKEREFSFVKAGKGKWTQITVDGKVYDSVYSILNPKSCKHHSESD